jgi:hypothetical protein
VVRFNFFFILISVLDYLQDRAKGSTLYGFRGGPAGIMKCKYVELTSDYIYPYRNQVSILSYKFWSIMLEISIVVVRQLFICFNFTIFYAFRILSISGSFHANVFKCFFVK